ncbi:DUF6220 domain-containing protein [Diaminobutyricimonas sp. LJ205]|uniref:DUF6220 domain-containing protein n=1 Tax=Diaminobutyricimonas sp. LJ205 TaxID=2683590 RepID=UPI0012F4B0C6|nr:DUF6220 domain-containing protein [Diaminobutyricimonas sp. LJ205]
MRVLFLVLSILMLIALTVQFYLAGIGVFSDPADELFAIHGMNGRFVLPIVGLLLFISAILAKAGGRTIGLASLPLVLVLFQTLWFILSGMLTGGEEGDVNMAATIMVSFHVLIGLAAFVVTYMLVSRARRLIATGSATVARDQETVRSV